MNSINHNSELSNFSNYLRKDLAHSLNLNDYQYDNPNSPSANFGYFNQYSQTSNPLEKQDIQVKIEENIEPKDQTIGFNHLQDFLQNSIQYPFEEFRNVKIKKPATFHYSHGYLNTLNDPGDLCKEQVSKNVEWKKQSVSKQTQKQNVRKSGEIDQKNEEKLNQANLDSLLLNQSIQRKKQSKKALSQQNTLLLYGQNCLQNLKSIAKIALQEIRKQKITSYQTISQSLLVQLSRLSASHEQSHSNKHERSSVSSEDKSSKKSELIETMIKNKSFSQIKQMTQIEEDSLETKTPKRLAKYQHDQNQSQLIDHEPKNSSRNIKNIRRRLYDAINVMLAANVIEKRERGFLSLKSLDSSYKTVLKSLRSRQENASMDDMQRKIEEKRKAIQAKKKYRQFLCTRYLLLQKQVTKNKTLAYKKEQKLPFPLVFLNLQWPMKLSIQSNSKSVEIESFAEIDVNCELDLLGLLYWVEKEETVRKEKEIEIRMESNQKLSDDQIVESSSGTKKVKISV